MERKVLVVHKDTQIISYLLHDIHFLLQILVVLIERRRKGIRMSVDEKLRFLGSLSQYFINQKSIKNHIDYSRKGTNMIAY